MERSERSEATTSAGHIKTERDNDARGGVGEDRHPPSPGGDVPR